MPFFIEISLTDRADHRTKVQPFWIIYSRQGEEMEIDRKCLKCHFYAASSARACNENAVCNLMHAPTYRVDWNIYIHPRTRILKISRLT